MEFQSEEAYVPMPTKGTPGNPTHLSYVRTDKSKHKKIPQFFVSLSFQ